MSANIVHSMYTFASLLFNYPNAISRMTLSASDLDIPAVAVRVSLRSVDVL